MIKRITNETLLKFIIVSFAIVILYSITAVLFQAITHEELSPTLTGCVFAFFGGEVLDCTVLKVFKIKKE